jgi:hypothetical protein
VLITPLPGVQRDRILEALREVSTNLSNLYSAGSGGNLYIAYTDWANSSAQKLSDLISGSDVDRLVLTRRYWLLQSMHAEVGTIPLQKLLLVEVAQQVRVMEVDYEALKAQIQHWSRPGKFALPDTSFYIRHPEKLEEADFVPLLHLWDEPVHVIIPILVVDELDGLKRSSDRHVRWRAGYTLAVLDRVLRNPSQPGQLRPADFSALDDRSGGSLRGEITLEIVFDPPGHSRLPISDDELIDRAKAIQALAAREVTMFTYDTGQAMRARNAGLPTEKLTIDPGPEPTKGS